MSRVSGWTVLSRIPFQQTSRQLPARRVAFLAAPVMLAAPMGSLVQQIAGAIAAWVLLLYVSTWMREASRTVVALRSWSVSGREEMEGGPGIVSAETPDEAVAVALAAI
jgi:hypothetical protein